MAGITGIFAFNQVGGFYMINLAKSIDTMVRRGPDTRGSFVGNDLVALGYRGYAGQETSYLGKQPFTEAKERYTIVFDGDFFNYKAQKDVLELEGHTFLSDAPAEIVLALFEKHGPACLNQIEGGFAFAIYDALENRLFLARDAFGIKPLLYYMDEDKFIFASEMNAMLAYNVPRAMDPASFLHYLQLGFLPVPHTLLKDIYRLEPGKYLLLKKKNLENKQYYYLPDRGNANGNFEDVKLQLQTLFHGALDNYGSEKISTGALLDGTPGAFFLALMGVSNDPAFSTFSLQVKKHAKENQYLSEQVKILKTNHSMLFMNAEDLQEEARLFLQRVDAPTGSLGALYLSLLYKKIAGKVKLFLTPAGNETILGGQAIHRLEFLLSDSDWKSNIIRKYSSFFKLFIKDKPFSPLHLKREEKLGQAERFWRYQTIGFPEALYPLLKIKPEGSVLQELELRKNEMLTLLSGKKSAISEIVKTELRATLSANILSDYDMASSAYGVATGFPYLEKPLVEFSVSLSAADTVDGSGKSKILSSILRDLIPERPVFLSKNVLAQNKYSWMAEELRPMMLNDDLLSREYIEEQGLFNYDEIANMMKRINQQEMANGGDLIWILLVFQHWYKKSF